MGWKRETNERQRKTRRERETWMERDRERAQMDKKSDTGRQK